MTRLSIAFAVFLAGVGAASAQVSVNGYYNSQGTYVAPHTRSAPNNSYNDNWSVRGNSNPYSGSYGTHSPTVNDRTPGYNQNHYGSPLYSTAPRY